MTIPVALRAGLLAVLVPQLLVVLLALVLGAVGLYPAGDAGWTLTELLLLWATLRVLTRGGPWLPPVPATLLWRPVPAASTLREALVLGGVAHLVLWSAEAISTGQPPVGFGLAPSVAQALGVPAAAMAEELIFRGYLLGLLARAGRVWAGVWVSTALFTAAHAPGWVACGAFWQTETLAAAAGVTASGLTFAAMTVLSGRIWPAVVFHAAHNLLGGLGPSSGVCG